MDKDKDVNVNWDVGTFEGALKAQVNESKKLTVAERIEWVCEMSECIRELHIKQGKLPPALDPDRYS
mgnify:CR=1 FL=1